MPFFMAKRNTEWSKGEKWIFTRQVYDCALLAQTLYYAHKSKTHTCVCRNEDMEAIRVSIPFENSKEWETDRQNRWEAYHSVAESLMREDEPDAGMAL